MQQESSLSLTMCKLSFTKLETEMSLQMAAEITVGIHQDRHGWGARWTAYCRKYGLDSFVFDMTADDWLDSVQKCDIVFYRTTMYPENIRIFKERVGFLANIVGKPTFPNWSSFWHFDSKSIQRDIFRWHGMPTPETLVGVTPHDFQSLKDRLGEQVVIKDPSGAGSTRVRKRDNSPGLRRKLSMWHLEGKPYRLLVNILRRVRCAPQYSPQKIVQRYIATEGYDLRVVTIGVRYAYIFRRNVRHNDFRASASGLIDHTWRDEYYDVIRMCMGFSRLMGFNSMAYDILVDRKGAMYIGEMSCQYTGKALINCPNVFWVSDDLGDMRRVKVEDPLELHVRALFEGCL